MRKMTVWLWCIILLGCSPALDWREIRGGDVPFTVLMPAKPSSQARPVVVGSTRVMMSMTVAQAENLTFAVGAARFASPAEALAAIEPMKHALVKNIGGKIIMEKAVDGKAGDRITAIDVEAVGASNAALQPARRLGARFVVKDDRAYQVVIVAPGELPTETVDTFLTSFKPE